MLKQVINPDIYHGWKKEKNFFEGWYFKIVNAKKDRDVNIEVINKTHL